MVLLYVGVARCDPFNIKVNKVVHCVLLICSVQSGTAMSPYLLLFLSMSLTPVSSSPGLAWSEEETLIVKAKLLVVMTNRQSVTKEYLKLHPELGLSSWPETKSMPNAAKMLRLGFHGCLKYSDGTGGCNGCLNNHNMGLENRHNCSKGEDNTMLPNSVRTDNAGLELTADILEEIYTNPDFPIWN